MYKAKQEYLNRKLPLITSQQSIHKFDKSRSKSIGRENQTRNNLSPYLAEVDRRRKVNSVLREKSDKSKSPNESRNDLSTRKFRIQEHSYHFNPRNTNSLPRKRTDSQHATITNANLYTNSSTINSAKNTIERKRGFSRSKALPKELTISRPSITIIDKDITDLYNKLKTKYTEKASKQQKGFRRGKYEEPEQQSSTIQTNLRKIAYTVNNLDKDNKEVDMQEIRDCHKTVISTLTKHQERKNFRRNKYQVQSQIISNSQLKQEEKYSSVDIQKKESNTSLIRQLDLQTQKQAQQQDRVISQKIQKILNKSIEKSTEQYFRQHPASRHLKSRNQIQIYMSTVKNPSINRCSQASTLNMSDKKDGLFISSVKSPQNQQLLNYDFNLQQQIAQRKSDKQPRQLRFHLEQQDEDTTSIHAVGQQSQFDLDRKEAERKFLQDDRVRITWQEELDCTVQAQLEQ